MMLTDREWLRFVTFGMVVGIVLGTLYTGAMLVLGYTLVQAMALSIAGCGLFALGLHILFRLALDRSSQPPTDDTPQPDSEGTA